MLAAPGVGAAASIDLTCLGIAAEVRDGCPAHAARSGDPARCRARSLTTEYETLGKHSSALVIFPGQATKGAWWMPWHEKAMKDAVSCDKPR